MSKYLVWPRIDHVVIYGGEQLDALADAYRRLGFTLTPRGHHTLGSSNHLAIFGDDYLELLGVQPENVARFGDGWNHPPGLGGLVFKTDDAQALWQRLSGQGVALAGEAEAFSRPVRLDDGTVQDARFCVVRIALDQFPNGRVFFCEQRTPKLVWQPKWQRHANGVQGIAEVVYVAAQAELQRLARLLAQITGAAPAAVTGGFCLRFGAAKVYFLERADAARLLEVAASQLPEKVGAVALTLFVRSLDVVREALTKGAVTEVRGTQGRVIVPAMNAGYTLLSFVEQPGA